MKLLFAFLLGVALALLSYRIDGRWLNSTAGVVRAIVALLVAGVLVAAWHRKAPWTGGTAVWAGAVAGMTGVLFRIGPGTIWPIVLVVGSAIAAAGVFGGVLLIRGLIPRAE